MDTRKLVECGKVDLQYSFSIHEYSLIHLYAHA